MRMSHLSIRQRLLVMILSVTFFSVILTSAVLSLSSVFYIKNNLEEELELTASVIAERNYMALSIGRRDIVSESLQIFRLRPAVQLACVYDVKHQLFAYYPVLEVSQDTTGIHDEEEIFCPVLDPDQPPKNREGTLGVFQPVKMRQDIIGHIYVLSDYSQIDTFIFKQILTVIVVVLSVGLIAFLLAMRLRSAFTVPLNGLLQAAQNVTSRRDYTTRVEVEPKALARTPQELVTLISAFNHMLSDIEGRDTNLRHANVQLEQAKLQAEAANMSKSRFLASISHELRTPLNAIIGFSSVMMSQMFGAIAPKYQEYAQDIHDSGIHLLEIINDILDLSKAEAGKLTLSMEEFRIDKALHKCLGIVADQAARGVIRIRHEIPDNLPYLIADRLRFIQIVLNILSNAIKFTPPGGHVLVKVECSEIDYKRHRFCITIQDTGVGMSIEEIGRAFQSFGQIDNDLNRKYEGTGLGLPLARKLMESHGGTLQLQSERGRGTSVRLIFISDVKMLGKTHFSANTGE